MTRKRNNIERSYFNRGYSKVLIYLNDHSGIDFPDDYVTPDGFELGRWLTEIRRLWRCRKLSREYVSRLQVIGICKDPKLQGWEEMYFYASYYHKVHGNIDIDISYRTEDGVLLGAWIDRQRRLKEELSKEQRKKLKVIGL